MRASLFLMGYFFNIVSGSAQQPIQVYDAAFGDSTTIQSFKEAYGKNKTLPPGFETQALIALSFYPELKETSISFRVEKAFIPLASRPTIWSLLVASPKKRRYQIIISTRTIDKLNPILLKELPFNAQIGVLGHELAHTAYYIHRSRWAMLGMAIAYLSPSFRNRFEFENDQRCIDHGLGYQLSAWSIQVRRVMKQRNWEGAVKIDRAKKEGYMNPETIEEILRNHPLYQY